MTKTRAEEILDCIRRFAEKYLSQELYDYAGQILKRVQKNPRLNIFKGETERWASAIVYVLARYNLLFDHEDKHHITPQRIASHFSLDLKAVIRRAEEIEKRCGLILGDRGISGDKVDSMLKFFKTGSGFVIPKLSYDTCLRNIDELSTAEADWFKRKIQEKIAWEKEKYRQRLLRKAQKKKARDKDQLELFG